MKSKNISRIVVVVTLSLCAMVSAVSAGESGLDATGPDVVVFDLFDTTKWGDSGTKTAYSVGTESCNRGDEPVLWVSNTNEHPVIAQNLYRLKDGRFEQLGQSWLKHGFVSVNGDACDTCQDPFDGSQLGVGCSDPYWASLNGSHGNLGPRSEVNAFTGEFLMPHSSVPDGGVLTGRLQVETSDVDPLLNSGALYFVEGQYVTQDDAQADNGINNASYRRVTVANDHDLIVQDATVEGEPAIVAWSELDPEVTLLQQNVPGEGTFFVAYKVSDNGDGTWRYEYAVFNMNSHRSARSFSVPVNADTVITNGGFRDVDSHSGEPFDTTDWAFTVDFGLGVATWSTDTFDVNENANALRWGTMYNFWFNADDAPIETTGSLGLFRPGSPDSLDIDLVGPGLPAGYLFADGFETGDTSAWQ